LILNTLSSGGNNNNNNNNNINQKDASENLITEASYDDFKFGDREEL
jgi:hypothetical protein